MGFFRRLVSGKYGTRAREADYLQLDALTNALSIISYGHREIHEENAFSVTVVDDTMADAETLSLAFKTPTATPENRAHVWFEFVTLVGAKLEVYEGRTWTQGTGTLVDVRNRFRGSTNQSVLLEDQAQPTFTASNKLIQNPTGQSGGTIIHNPYAWGEKGKIGAGATREIGEWVLKPDETYVALVTAIGAANKCMLALNWYEHTDTH